MERRYSKTDFYNGKFYQLGKELFKGKYKGMSNNERVIYAVLKDRFELSIANGWVDENNDIFFYFDQNQLAEESCISRSTVQRSLNILVEQALIESVRQGVNLPNRLYLLKPELQEMEKKGVTNTDEIRMLQNEASGSVKMKHPEASKRSMNYTEKIDTNYSSSPMAESEFDEEEKEFEYIAFDGSVEKITDENDIVIYINAKTNIENDELSSQYCKRVRGILLQIFNPFDNEIEQFKVDGKIIVLDMEIRKKMYRLLSPKLFVELVKAIQNNSEPIRSLKAFVLACLYNHASCNIGNFGRAAPNPKYNNNNVMMQRNDINIDELEKELLHNQN